ncbi:MAG: DUF998 domain-containing protein [Propionibacteriales bacterium]|nr:DUF998 domain-containing protein [Propionibacteriales bacterium]
MTTSPYVEPLPAQCALPRVSPALRPNGEVYRSAGSRSTIEVYEQEGGDMSCQLGGAAAMPASRPVVSTQVRTALAAAGIVGPILFTVGFVTQELFRIDEYSPLAERVSALEAGPNGWVQQVNFVVFGILTIAFAGGLHLGVRPSRAGALGPAILAVSGVGLLLAAALPLREDAAGVTYDPNGHVVAGITFFLSSGLGLFVLSQRLVADPRWGGLAGYALVAGAVGLVSFPLIGVFW